MGTLDKQGLVTMQELLVSSLAQTDVLTKLLIEKGLAMALVDVLFRNEWFQKT